MEATTRYHEMGGKNYLHWLLSAFLAMISFAGGSFLIAGQSSDPYELKLTISFAYLISIITLGIFHMIELRIRNGFCPSLYPRSILTRENGLVPGFTIGIIGGIFLFIAQFLLLLAWNYDPSGVGITLVSLGGISPITSFLSFIVYRERLSILQIAGMLITVGGIIYLNAQELSADGGDENKTLTSIAYGVGAMFLFSFRNLTGRAMGSKTISIYTGVILNSAGEVMSGVVLLVWMCIDQRSVIGSTFVDCLIGSLVLAYSLYFINHSIATGNIGVVITLINCNGVAYLLIDYIFNNRPPTTENLIAIPIIIFGIVILLFGDQFRSQCKRNTSRT